MSLGSVLVVEDDLSLREALCDTLQLAGYPVLSATNGNAALDLIEHEKISVVVSDVQMQPMDGFSLLRKLRMSNPNLPVVLMTAYGTIQKAVQAIREGASDYLVKPFDVEELVARVRALIARSRREPAANVLELGDLKFDTSAMQVERAEQAITLTPIGMRILHLLFRHSPHVVHRRDIEREIWGELPPDSDALRSHMYNLRKAVDKPFDFPLIHTVHNIGFRLSDESQK